MEFFYLPKKIPLWGNSILPIRLLPFVKRGIMHKYFKLELWRITMSKTLKEFLVYTYKSIAVILMFMVFFLLFSQRYPSLITLSRSLAVTSFAYVMSYILFSNIYGSLQIGKFKSKQVIYSSALAVFFTDIISYLALMVMQTNPNNIWANKSFTLENFDILILVFLTQILIIIFVAYNGNYLYFKLYAPQKSLVVFDNEYLNDMKIQEYLLRYKKQYLLTDSIDIRDSQLNEKINQSDFVIFCEMNAEIRNNLSEVCYLEDIDFAYTPSIADVVEMSGFHTTYGDKPIVEVRVNSITFNQRVVKRIMDIVVSLTGIILTSPIWLIFIIAIKIDDGGPIFFSHLRKTINGKDFKVYKFRSMKVDSPNVSAAKNDDRITRVGKVLRKIRLDELPQLLNILKGDMSLVGPRPEMLENVTAYEEVMPEFRYRLKAKAGLTGIAQIEGKYNTLPKDKLILDLIYIENYSIWLDIKLLFKTVIIFFKKDSTEGF